MNWTTAAAFLIEGRLDHTPRTFYHSVDSIGAGTAFEIDADGSWKQWRYWHLDEVAGALDMPARPEEAFAELFENAVALRLRSDVSVGVLLSGGLDSTSIICSMARQLGRSDRLGAYCYSAKEFDETQFIEATVQQTGAQLRLLDTSALDVWNSIRSHLWHQDEPVHSFSSVVGFELMKLARASGATVLLNGQGADEVLGGYPSYYQNHVFDLIRSLDWRRASAAIRDFSSVQGTPAMAIARRGLRGVVGDVLQHFDWYSSAARRARRRAAAKHSWLSRDLFPLLDESPPEQPASLDGALKYSVETDSLPLYLRVEDRNSMAHATEVRLPFLDYRLVSLAFRLGCAVEAAQWRRQVRVARKYARANSGKCSITRGQIWFSDAGRSLVPRRPLRADEGPARRPRHSRSGGLERFPDRTGARTPQARRDLGWQSAVRHCAVQHVARRTGRVAG